MITWKFGPRRSRIGYRSSPHRRSLGLNFVLFLKLVFVVVACNSPPSLPEGVTLQTALPTPTFEPTFTPPPLPTGTTQPSPTATPQSALSGRILDQASGQPIAGASVNADTYTATSDAEGRYTLTGLPPGQYVLSVTHPDYDPGLSSIFTLAAGQEHSLDLALYTPDTSPYPKDPMLTNPLDPNGAPTAEDAERLARLQGLTSEVVDVQETKLSGEYLVNYRIGDEVRAAVAKLDHDAWKLTDEEGQTWWIIKVCGNLVTSLPGEMAIATPQPRALSPMAEVVLDELIVRACASEACAEVGTLQLGIRVEVIGCLGDGSWCHVSLPGGGSGWCTGRSLRHLALAASVPALEAAGWKIGFLSDRDGKLGVADIYLMNPDGSGQVRVSNGLGVSSPLANSLSDLDDRFAWSAVHRKYFYSTSSGKLYAVESDGRDATFIAENVYRFDLSPDGRHIAYETEGITVTTTIYTTTPQGTTVSQGEARRSDIAIMAIDGTGKLLLTDESTSNSLGLRRDFGLHAPAWAPNDRQIAFNAGGHLAVMQADGTQPAVLVPASAADVFEPFNWSPDGNFISFDNRDSPHFHFVDVATKKVSELPVSGLDFVWSPDGSQIAFYRGGPTGIPLDGPPPPPDISLGEWQIWVMNADGSGLTQLTFAGHNCCPVWVY